jgi:hypothetical protein
MQGYQPRRWESAQVDRVPSVRRLLLRWRHRSRSEPTVLVGSLDVSRLICSTLHEGLFDLSCVYSFAVTIMRTVHVFLSTFTPLLNLMTTAIKMDFGTQLGKGQYIVRSNLTLRIPHFVQLYTSTYQREPFGDEVSKLLRMMWMSSSEKSKYLLRYSLTPPYLSRRSCRKAIIVSGLHSSQM